MQVYIKKEQPSMYYIFIYWSILFILMQPWFLPRKAVIFVDRVSFVQVRGGEGTTLSHFYLMERYFPNNLAGSHFKRDTITRWAKTHFMWLLIFTNNNIDWSKLLERGMAASPILWFFGINGFGIGQLPVCRGCCNLGWAAVSSHPRMAA